MIELHNIVETPVTAWYEEEDGLIIRGSIDVLKEMLERYLTYSIGYFE